MRPCRLTGRSGETCLVDAAPAGGARNRAPGRPQPAVRRHYDRLPTSRAARVDDEGAVATAPDKGRHGLSPTGSAAPRGQKPPQVERREAPSSDRKEEGDASQASRAASPAAQGVSQTPASAGAPLPSGSEELHFGLRRTRRRSKNTGDKSCPSRRHEVLACAKESLCIRTSP